MTPGPTTRVRPHPQAVFRELGGDQGAVLLQLETSGYHEVNTLGALIWGLLAENPTVSELVEAVDARVTGAPPALADEVTAFVDDLAGRELVVLEPAAA